jgi:hypothetical protein
MEVIDFTIAAVQRERERAKTTATPACSYRIPFLLFGFALLFSELLFLRGPSHGGINP